MAGSQLKVRGGSQFSLSHKKCSFLEELFEGSALKPELKPYNADKENVIQILTKKSTFKLKD